MSTLMTLLDEGVPLTAVGFSDSASPQTLMEAKIHGLDVAELRIDLYASSDTAYVVSEIKKFSNFYTLATIRLASEGGNWEGNEAQRLALFHDILPCVDAVDIELHAEEILPKVVKDAHAQKKLVLISYHNFQETPSLIELQSIMNSAWDQGADLVKIAVHANQPEDVQTLAQLTLANKDKRLITIAMGADGLVSRAFFPVLGSRITFAYLDKPTAPGQLRFQEMFDLLRQFYPRFNQRKINELEILEAA